MSVNCSGVLEMRSVWLVERVWEWIGTLRCVWIRVLSCEIVMFGFGISRRSKPSLDLILINIFFVLFCFDFKDLKMCFCVCVCVLFI